MKSVIVWHNILTIALLDDVMFKLWWLSISFLSLLCLQIHVNVGINLPTTEDAYIGMTKYLLLCLDREYKQWS